MPWQLHSVRTKLPHDVGRQPVLRLKLSFGQILHFMTFVGGASGRWWSGKEGLAGDCIARFRAS